MRKNIIFTLLFVGSLFAGCRKDSPDVIYPSDESYTIYSENYWSSLFDGYWSAMSQNYLFWKYETIDWDAIYDEYAPKFAMCDSLCMNDPNGYFAHDYEAFDSKGELMYDGDFKAGYLFNEITTQLLDHHYALTLYDINFMASGSGEVEVPKRDYYHDYNDIGLYEGLKHIIDYEENTTGRITNLMYGEYYVDESSSSSMCMVSYLIDGSIPYIYFSSFAITTGLDDEEMLDHYELPIDGTGNATKCELLDNFEYLVKNTPNMKGAIIDVRGNGGGNNNDLDALLGCFINKDESIHFANTQHKSGPNRYDYTEVAPCYIYGTSDDPTYRFPIVMLADVHSVSMSEITCIATRAFSDKSIMVGERTYGGTGSLVPDYILSGGKIETDYMEIYTCSTLFYDLDMNFYEGVGVTPNIEVLFDESTWGITTTDKQKETAIEYIKSL